MATIKNRIHRRSQKAGYVPLCRTDEAVPQLDILFALPPISLFSKTPVAFDMTLLPYGVLTCRIGGQWYMAGPLHKLYISVRCTCHEDTTHAAFCQSIHAPRGCKDILTVVVIATAGANSSILVTWCIVTAQQPTI